MVATESITPSVRRTITPRLANVTMAWEAAPGFVAAVTTLLVAATLTQPITGIPVLPEQHRPRLRLSNADLDHQRQLRATGAPRQQRDHAGRLAEPQPWWLVHPRRPDSRLVDHCERWAVRAVEVGTARCSGRRRRPVCRAQRQRPGHGVPVDQHRRVAGPDADVQLLAPGPQRCRHDEDRDRPDGRYAELHAELFDRQRGLGDVHRLLHRAGRADLDAVRLRGGVCRRWSDAGQLHRQHHASGPLRARPISPWPRPPPRASTCRDNR